MQVPYHRALMKFPMKELVGWLTNSSANLSAWGGYCRVAVQLALLPHISCCDCWGWLVCCCLQTVWDQNSWNGRGCLNRSDSNCMGNGKNVFESRRVCWSQSRQGLGSEVFCSGPGWGNSVWWYGLEFTEQCGSAKPGKVTEESSRSILFQAL